MVTIKIMIVFELYTICKNFIAEVGAVLSVVLKSLILLTPGGVYSFSDLTSLRCRSCTVIFSRIIFQKRSARWLSSGL
jgi:hypothetical protein